MSFFDTISNGLSSLINPARSFLGTLAPYAGTALGGFLGGPAGAAIGGMGGGLLGGLIRGDNADSYHSLGQAAGNLLNSAVPEQYRNMPVGQIGRNAQNYFGSSIDQGLGRYISPSIGRMGIGNSLVNAGSDWLHDRFRGMMPGQYSNQTPSQLASSAGNYFQNMLPNVSSGGMPGGFSSPGGDYLSPPGMGQQGDLNNMSPRFSVNPGMGYRSAGTPPRIGAIM